MSMDRTIPKEFTAGIIVHSDYSFRISGMFYACPIGRVHAERLIVEDTRGREFFSYDPVALVSLLSGCISRPIKLVARKLFDDDAPQCVIVSLSLSFSLGSAYYINMPCVRADCRITKSE